MIGSPLDGHCLWMNFRLLDLQRYGCSVPSYEAREGEASVVQESGWRLRTTEAANGGFVG